MASEEGGGDPPTIPRVRVDSADSTPRYRADSMDSSDGDYLFTTSMDLDYSDQGGQEDGCRSDDPGSSPSSDTEVADPEDYAYYQDVYRFVGGLKAVVERRSAEVTEELQRRKESMKVELERKKERMKEAVIEQKERLREKSREKLDAGKEKIHSLQRKTYRRLKRLKTLEPTEDYRQKVIFTKSVLTLVLKTFATCAGQWLLPWYYALTCPTLIAWRIVTYWQCQFQYFCRDFCYFGNLIISLILWFRPSSPELCALQFSIAHGMLFLGAFSFRNSLVFHSVDKMTSTYIHTVPVLLTFGIRWFPEESSRFWHSSFPETANNPPSLVWVTITIQGARRFHTREGGLLAVSGNEECQNRELSSGNQRIPKMASEEGGGDPPTIPRVRVDSVDSTPRYRADSMDSSDGDYLFTTSMDLDYSDQGGQEDGCRSDDPGSSPSSDTEVADPEDYAYYQDVIAKHPPDFRHHLASSRLVTEELQRRKESMKVELERKKERMKEAVIEQKERLREKSREKLDAGKEKIHSLQRKTYRRLKRLKTLEPTEDYRQKVIFTKSVLTLVLKTFATCAGQWLLPWYYALTCPTLIAWRIVTYWQCQFQYFCLDFCYFGNLIISLILWFRPSSPELCALQFSIAHGMLFLGAFSFRNSLVFHSVDKMTSTYIHTVPVLLTFGIRWFPEESSRFWHSSFPETANNPPSLVWNLLAPCIVMVTHTILYTVLVNVILQPEEHIVTSFRYLRAKKSVKKMFGPNPPYIVFVGMNWILCILMSSFTLLAYRYYWINVCALVVLLVFITWNGACYYFDIFRMSMAAQKQSNRSESKKNE
eukprot:sb/3462118/